VTRRVERLGEHAGFSEHAVAVRPGRRTWQARGTGVPAAEEGAGQGGRRSACGGVAPAPGGGPWPERKRKTTVGPQRAGGYFSENSILKINSWYKNFLSNSRSSA